MPRFDRTGPMGSGPMTGGARGLCHPANADHNPRVTGGYGSGLGLRRGFRGRFGLERSRRHWFAEDPGWYPPEPAPAYLAAVTDELDRLKAEASFMQKSLKAINKRIGELEKKPSEES